MNTNHDARWGVSQHVRATYSGDGAVLLDIEKGLCYSLNTVAARIWVAIESSDAGITLEGVVGALETHFKVPRKELEGDTAEWLTKLERMGLLHSNGHRASSKGFGIVR